MNLGIPEISLNVNNISSSIEFYSALGFKKVDGDEKDKWVAMEQKGIRIGLYEGHVPDNSITFFGGNVEQISDTLINKGIALTDGPCKEEDGTMGTNLRDPDGNRIYFNT